MRKLNSSGTGQAGYAKCGSIVDSLKLFENMPERDVASWTTMITGYAQLGHNEMALKFYCKMQNSGMKADELTFASVLSACAGLAVVIQGRRAHGVIIRSGFDICLSVGNALITMYAKCGVVDDAFQMFDTMVQRDMVTWSAMITGYALHGHGEEAVQLFEQMLATCMKPDHVSFVGVLYACSHAGLVNEGRQYFDSMMRDHGITPGADHYACLIDLLGHAGHLDEAEEFINNMPFEHDVGAWGDC